MSFHQSSDFWSSHKAYCRANCRYSIVGLRKVVPQGLDAVCCEQVRRFFGVCRRYEAAYRLGLGIDSIAKAVALTRYTSHRRVLDNSGILKRLSDMNLSSEQQETMTGLCYCHECLPYILERSEHKVSHVEPAWIPPSCNAPRCAEHGSVLTDADTPRLPYAVNTRKKEEYVMCERSTCRKWRLVAKSWLTAQNKKNPKPAIYCSMLPGSVCEDECAFCDSTPCECVCDDCEKQMLQCSC